MIEKLVQDLIESIVDTMVATTVAMAADHQQRRDKIDAYRSALHPSATNLLTFLGEAVRETTRNRYIEWIEHPRLGHEPLSAEVHASDVGLHEAVMAVKLSPTVFTRIQLTGACIRLSAITEVVGPECIYLPSIKRAAPVKAARRNRAALGDQDKRLNRRKPVIGDVPASVLPIVARLGSDNPDRPRALATLEAQRGEDHDRDGIITKLATLAALDKHRAFMDDLAAAAKAAVGVEVTPLRNDLAASAGTNIVTDTVPATSPTPVPAPSISVGQIDDAVDAKIVAVVNWCRDNRWAVIPIGNGYGLKRLAKRGDLNVIFDSVAAHPEMQSALREICEGPKPAEP